ncbi:hypothetical protein Anas_14445, partial [Armadillidium nasatum]
MDMKCESEMKKISDLLKYFEQERNCFGSIDVKNEIEVKEEPFDVEEEEIELKEETFDVKEEEIELKEETFDVKEEETELKEEPFDFEKKDTTNDETFDNFCVMNQNQ